MTLVIFDGLSVDGKNVVSQPSSQRRRILEDLELGALQRRTPDVFDDDEALCEAVCAHELEGVAGHYLPGARGSVNTTNRCYWRWELEREGALSRRRDR